MRRALVALFAALLFVTPAFALEAGSPDANELERLVQARLDSAFDKGLLRVVDVQQVRSFTQHVAGDDRERMMVFFEVELKFTRSYDLSDWGALSAGSLVWMLGTTPDGIRGINADGNRRGDVLEVAATMPFAREGEDWTPIGADARASKEPPADETVVDEPQAPGQLERIAELIERSGQPGMESEAQQLSRDLDHTIAMSESRAAHSQGLLRLATGSESGEYHALGNGLVEQLNAEAETFHVVPTGGSAANCSMVSQGQAEAALTQNDIAYMAYQGSGLFLGEMKMTNLRAVCSVFPEAIQIVTLADSDIGSVGDLAGRAVDLGPDASGTRFNAAQLLESAGVQMGDLGRVQGKVVGDALDDLVAGTVDAVFVTGVYPFFEISAHAARTPLKLVALTEEQVGQLWQEAAFMLPITIPAHTYAGQEEAVRTAGVTALLVTHDQMPDEAVAQLLDGLLSNGAALSQHSVQAYFISTATADRGISIPLHPAAKKYLEGPK
jgi:TRAP transporter TAXI family solute receptor